MKLWPASGGLIARIGSHTRGQLIAAVFALLLLVASADYLTGYELSFSIFYLGAILLAGWFVGPRFALLVSIVSVACWLFGDLAAGAVYSTRFVPVWNAAILLSFYLVIVAVLGALRTLHDKLEAKVRERTQELTSEMAARQRLEKELLAVSEREQRRIGQDLHDSLCQHLTGTALAGHVLGEKLAGKDLPEAADAKHVVVLVEQAIELARSLAHGLAPLTLEDEGLTTAFQSLALHTSKGFRVDCRFEAPDPAPIGDPAVAMHLFRIGQEAVGNALKHGHAKHVVIRLQPRPKGIQLRIEDDGCGLPEPLPERRGIGLQIMQHRAAMIGGTLEIQRLPQGTAVECLAPQEEPDEPA